MTQVPRAEAGQAEAWVTSPNYGEFRQVTVGLQCPVHCLLQAFNPLIPRWPELGPARRTASCSCCLALGQVAIAGRGDLDDELAHPVPGPRSPARPASRRRRATRCGPWADLRAVPEAARVAEVTAGGPARCTPTVAQDGQLPDLDADVPFLGAALFYNRPW